MGVPSVGTLGWWPTELGRYLRLLVITDPKLRPDVVRSVEEALRGGATSIQLRMKEASTRTLIAVGREIRRLTRDYGALYFVDDRVDVALATDADGVQLGPDDMPISVAREVAPNLLVGASVYSLKEALDAEAQGAHFLGAGSVYPSPSKPNARVIGLDGLRAIVRAVRVPVVAIGGITESNVLEVMEAGVVGVAVISAVMGAPDASEAAARLRSLVDRALSSRVGRPDPRRARA
jgi:thiamine-phosphate pyrophosphorylase